MLDTVVAVKDAVGDFARGVRLTQLGYAVYSGDDVSNLGWLAHGAAASSRSSATSRRPDAAMLDAFLAGDHAEALEIFTRLLPAIDAVMGVRQLRRHHRQGRRSSCSACSTTATSAARWCRSTTTRSPRSAPASRPPACCRP